MSPFGILNLNKPSGGTSRAVVDAVIRVVGKEVKAGHAGTLDPLASGVLVVCLGPATRLIDYVQQMPKRYLGTFLLGRTSDTEDTEGNVTLLEGAPQPERATVEAAAAQLVGTILQRPPAYSALKVAGRRAYKLARQGQQPVLKPRPVTIHSMEVIDYEYPRLTLDIRCSSGTYVRSLGRDLAERLGTGAVMSELVRTEIGRFLLADACDLTRLTRDNLNDHLLPPRTAIEGMTVVKLSSGQIARIANGRALQLDLPKSVAPAEQVVAAGTSSRDTLFNAITEFPREIAAVDARGELIALLEPRGAGLWGPSRVLVESRASHNVETRTGSEASSND